VREKGKRVFFREPGSETEEGKSLGGVPGEVPERRRNLVVSGETEKGDREIFEKPHEAGSRALYRGAFVFPEDDVPDQVLGLDSPMSANEGDEAFWRGFFGRKTGDAVDHFRAGMAAIEFGGVAFEAVCREGKASQGRLSISSNMVGWFFLTVRVSKGLEKRF